MVINAFVMALALLGLRILLCCVCACASSMCKAARGSRNTNQAAPANPKLGKPTRIFTNSTRIFTNMKQGIASADDGAVYVQLPGEASTSTSTSTNGTSTSNPIVHAGVPVQLSVQEQV
mmetsp:Transcript_11849/g.20906  ORF Transcript_11849/g.20906 Transcript_11849/m.20906 type:complete len:119 (-) Transcript_11849:279-635(-)